MDTYSNMGHVYALLIENREIYNKPIHRRLRPGEKEAAVFLQDLDFFDAMQDFVSAQGFELRSYSDVDMPGIAMEGRCYLLLRRADADSPSFGENTMLEAIAFPGESKEVRATWFLHLWCWTNYLLYTAVQRSVEEVSRHTEVAFTYEDLFELGKEYVEQLRHEGAPENSLSHRIWEILVDPKQNFKRRIRLFLQAMVAGRFLYQPSGEEIYRQSLLGAVEMNDLFTRGMATLVPSEQVQSMFIEIVDLATQKSDTRQGGYDGAY